MLSCRQTLAIVNALTVADGCSTSIFRHQQASGKTLCQNKSMGAGRKRKAAPWDKAKGWKQVKVGDDLMIGSTESGFMGLEVLEPEETLLFGHHKRQAVQAPDAEDQEMLAEVDAVETNKMPKQTAEKPKKKKAKLSEPQTIQTSAKGTDKNALDLLTAKITALEAENSALKAQNASQPDTSTKKVKKKAAQGKATAAGSALQPQDADASAATEQVDISAWSQFDLHAQIAAAIAQAGFAQPTPIQEQCLLPAIRDRRDVIGAAQTVSASLRSLHALQCCFSLVHQPTSVVTQTNARSDMHPQTICFCCSRQSQKSANVCGNATGIGLLASGLLASVAIHCTYCTYNITWTSRVGAQPYNHLVLSVALSVSYHRVGRHPRLAFA